MTDFQAALGYLQLIKYKKNLNRRHQIAKRYIDNLSNFNEIKLMPYSKNCSFFVFQVFVKKRDQILSMFKKMKIGASVHYLNPLPKMTYYRKKYQLNVNKYICAKNYGLSNISLPIYPKLKNKEIDKICNLVKKVLKK